MRNRLLWSLFLFAGFVVPAQAQDTVTVSFPGGEIRVPAIIELVPCPECPPPPVWECPEGWTCTPPDTVPSPLYVLATPTGDYVTGDTIPEGQYDRFFEDAAGEWRALGLGYNAARIPGIDSVVFYQDGQRRNRESLWPYGVLNERGNWPAEPGRTYDLAANIYRADGEVEQVAIEVIANPNVPPVPPDTVPFPTDSVPPEPGDTLQWHLGLLFINQAGDSTLVRQGTPSYQWDAELREGSYDAFILEVDPGIERWDSVHVGHPSDQITCTSLPCPIYGGNPVTFRVDSTGLETSHLISYEVWGDSLARPDKINPWFIEGTLFSIRIAPAVDSSGFGLYSAPCQYSSEDPSTCIGHYLPADSTYADGSQSIGLRYNGDEDLPVDYVTFFARDSNWSRAWTLNDPLPWQTFEDSGASFRIPQGIRLNSYDNTHDDEDFWGDVTLGYTAGNILASGGTEVVARDSVMLRIR